MTVEEKIEQAIMKLASAYAKKPISSMDEVDELYNAGTLPALNDAIDYILYGEN